MLIKQKYHTILSRTVILLRRGCELFSYIQATAAEDLKVGFTPAMGDIRHLHELNASELLCAGRLNFSPIKRLKVVQVAQLARLTDSFAASEPLVPEKP